MPSELNLNDRIALILGQSIIAANQAQLRAEELERELADIRSDLETLIADQPAEPKTGDATA